EVTALVEWPIVLRGAFDKRFLSVPKEALISAMETHQKCFPVENAQNQLQPYFILVSNIDSKNQDLVIQGNERVIRARLSDAEFFYQQDCKHPLIDYLPRLDNLIFQDQLGSVGDKTKRLVKLADWIAKKIGADQDATKRAALLSKCDLLTGMVSEFPNLQGTMGYYYALNDQESEIVAHTIKEYYLPKFSGDYLPNDLEACSLALADRLDTLVGIFGINQLPTGDKDPFGLRRAALGVLRILIEKNINLDLMDLLKKTENQYHLAFPNENVIQNLFDFMMVRLKSIYIEKNISSDIFEAVLASKTTSPVDFDRRINAVVQFQFLPEASSLSAANKRVSNMLKKEEKNILHKKINENLFENEAEKMLFKELMCCEKIANDFYNKFDYANALKKLATLKDPIDHFFNDVMIMATEEKIRQNRFALLSMIRELFTKVADISLLP
ncbi:MAG: glycine--tRNA ligase subunit beta, partial [Gammaproteobacteria bacterium RIFCSPHIGHO2_12_FULL_38_14]